ncbi:40S ribosomal protein S15a-1 [Cucumis melo var. makuwa]|uniref:40S ribosomal protein S15a-1 n=1 Tax=Cucumis melo var. makuwa TaxID=1194695 RepID=A0A5D3BZI3_CUCMM|nr:40S ribosomal protein S15a-1 [Cucumis melo var. makuwa]
MVIGEVHWKWREGGRTKLRSKGGATGDSILIFLSFHSRRESSSDKLGVIGEEKVDENLNRPERIDVIRRLKVQNNQNGASANNLNIRANIYGKGFERLPDKTNCVGSLHDAIYRPQSTSVDDLVPSYPVEKKKDVPNTSQAIVSYTKTYTKKITDRQVDNSYELMIPCMVNESDASESGIKAKDGILATNPCIAECSGEKIASGNLSDNISFDQNRNGDHALITCQSNAEHLSKLQAIIVSKETALSQAAIKALIRKRDKLSHQQRLIEDEIAQCDKNMQTILRALLKINLINTLKKTAHLNMSQGRDCQKQFSAYRIHVSGERETTGHDQAFSESDYQVSSGYAEAIGEFEFVDDERSGEIVVELNGRLNKCGAISLHFDVGVKEIEGWIARLLPSRQFGFIVLCSHLLELWIMKRLEGRMLEAKSLVSSIEHGCNKLIKRTFNLYCHMRHAVEDAAKMELDGICHKNNWILPVYGVSSLDGGFQANVFVKGMDFEYSSCGELCSDPRDARESAAMKMLDGRGKEKLFSLYALQDCVALCSPRLRSLV